MSGRLYIYLDDHDLPARFPERLGVSTISITHDLSSAHYLGGDIMMIRKGAVVETGTVDNVLKIPQHAYIRLLLESIPSPDPRWTTSVGELAELERTAGVSHI